jgi:DNA transformation protein and related proteins
MKSNEFVEYVMQDLLAHISGITARAMFGGHGLYHHGKIFGIIINDELYFKADAELQKTYLEAGSKPFTYDRNGKTCSMKYFNTPENILNNREILEQWVAWSCAISTIKKKPNY